MKILIYIKKVHKKTNHANYFLIINIVFMFHMFNNCFDIVTY